MLTVCDGEGEKIEALNLGADGYVTKPFSTRELVARIRAAVRYTNEPQRDEDEPIKVGEIRFEPVRRIITRRGQLLHLTPKVFYILRFLMGRAGQSVTYAELLTAVWGADCREEIEYLRVFVGQLRKKIKTILPTLSICSPMYTSDTILPTGKCSVQCSRPRTAPPSIRKWV
jgi:two-component system, OmpR family, KDP operon response regulator KdpE